MKLGRRWHTRSSDRQNTKEHKEQLEVNHFNSIGSKGLSIAVVTDINIEVCPGSQGLVAD